MFQKIERAQYFSNAVIYDCKMGQYRNTYGTPLSFLEYMLLETEKLHAKVRRYTSPEEHPFFPTMLPSPILPPLNYPEILTGKTEVNVNNELLRWHVEKIIKRLCKPGDDEQHGR
jgi:chorismate mutase